MNKRILKTLIIGSFLTLFYFAFKTSSEVLTLDANTNEELMIEENIYLEEKEMDVSSSLIKGAPDPSLFGIQVIPYTGTYDGNYHSIQIILPKKYSDATITYSYDNINFTTTPCSFKDPGVYTVQFKIALSSGLLPGSSTVTINKITVDTSSYYNYQIQEFVYDGAPHFPTYNITKPAEATAMDYGLCPETDAGTYSITYTFTYDTSIYIIPDVVLQWKIVPKTVNIIWGDGNYFSYNGSEHKPTAYYLDINAGIHGLTLVCQDGFVNAGKHTAVATKTDNLTNYKLPDDSTLLTHEFTIYAVDISDANVTHGSTSLTYNGLEQGPEITSITLPDWEEEITYELQGLATDYSSSNYTLKICGTGNYTGEISIPYQINKKEAAVVWPTSPTYIYNGTVQSYTPYILDVFGEAMGVSVTFDREFKDAGTYTMIVNEASYPNYSLTNVTSQITMNPIVTTIVFEQTEYTYNGKVQEVKAYYTNCLNNKEYVTVTIDGEFKDAGTYDVEANVDDITNYTLSNTTTTATIAPYEVEINWPTHISYVYYHNVQQVIPKITDPLGNVIQISATTDREFKDAGTYDVEVDAINYPNYSFTNPTWQAIMNPATATIVFEQPEYTYNGLVQEVKAYYTNCLNNKEYVTVTIDGEFKDAGTYDVEANVDDITNYTLSNTTAKLTISPLEVEVNWSNNDYTYTGTVQEITAKYSDVSNNEQDLIVTIDKEFKNAGEYVAQTSLTDTNYELTNPTKNYDITPIEVEVVWPETTFVYNGEIQEVEAYFIDIEENEISTIVTFDREFKNKGEYLATASIEDSNYTIKNPTHPYSMLVFEVEVIWCEDDYTYNGKVQEITAKYCDISNNEQDLIVSINKEFKDAGEYDALAILNDNNYLLTNKTKTYTMKKYSVEIKWSDNDYTYNSQIKKIDASYVDYEGNTIGLSVSTDKMFRDADNYVATVSINDDNIEVSNTTKEYTIKPLTREVIWNDVKYTYNGTVQEITAGYLDAANFLRAATITIDKEFKDAGDYVATASIENTNYELTNITYNYSILPNEIEATWSKDEFTYNGNTKEITASYEDIEGNVFDLLIVNGQNIDANTYVATATIEDSNYVLSNPTHEYVINPLEVEVKWNENEYIYNGNVQEITAYFTNVNYEKIPVSVTIDNDFINVGTYIASATSMDSNYTLTNTTCEYEILPLEVSAFLEDKEYIYNDKVQVVEMYYINVFNEKVSLTSTTTNNSFRNAGNYIATATLDDANYVLVDTEHSVTMKPYKVEVYSDSKDYYYNGEVQEALFKYKNVNNEEVVIYTLKMKDVNSYKINFEIRDRNYELEGNASASVTMNKGNVAIPNLKTITFDYTGGIITYLPDGFDENTMSITNNKHAESNTDGYQVKISLKDKDNYAWSDGTVEDKTCSFKIKNAVTKKKGCKSSAIPSVLGLLSIASFLALSKKKRVL